MLRRVVLAGVASLLIALPALSAEGHEAKAAETSDASVDPVSRARALAYSGQRAEAIELLQAELSHDPEDNDARVLLGIVLSWEARHAEARAELSRVLERRPDHGDALPALIRLEMWADETRRAEELARGALLRSPDWVAVLLLHAKALHDLEQDDEALHDLDRALALEPDNQAAVELRARIRESRRLWIAQLAYGLDAFDDGQNPWHEAQASLKRQTRFGAVIVRYSHAHRFSLDDDQVELEAYPRLRPGTYAYVNVGFSPESVLYPDYRVAGDLYQSLPWSLELSGGYRRLGFGDAVDIWTAYLAKYYGNWLFWVRTYLTPGAVGTSRSFQFASRRYFGDGIDYLGLRYSHGSAPEEQRTVNDVLLLDSDGVQAEANWSLGTRWIANLTAGWSHEERILQGDLNRFTAGLSLSYRF